MSKRLLILICVSVGLSVHAAVIVGLHNRPLKTHFLHLRNGIAGEPKGTDRFARSERAELLAEVLNQIHEVEPELKDQFQELQTEYAPSIDLALAAPCTLNFEMETFAFTPSVITEEQYELSPLLSKAPIFTSTETSEELENHAPDAAEIAKSEYFDVEVEYAPKRSRPGYVFKATFYPHQEVVFNRIGQNIFFLIDRSNSIPRARYQLNKRAVSEALNYLQKGDTFNILIFDNKIVRLAEEPLTWSAESVDQARAFLEHQPHGGHFAATELYASLGKIIPQDVSDHEVNTAILLSDGDSYLSQEKQRRMIADWTARNQGKISLYSIASGSGNNLPLLDLLSSFNQGRLIYSRHHNDLNPIIVNLLRAIQTPIGKEMVATPVSGDKQTVILLQPKAVRLPDLYQERPFVVYGSLNRLDDFVLFLQGKYYDRPFSIKKTIRFDQAKCGSYTLERKWTQLLAHEFYANYLEDGNRAHLEAAKRLLHPMDIPTAWID